MNVLGIDFGTEHVGLAIGSTETRLAEPIGREIKPGEVSEIRRICGDNNIGKIVIGVSENKSAERSAGYAKRLADMGLPIEMYDETLTTKEAVNKLLHLSAKKRQQREHGAAAAVILQNWLDDNV